MNIACLRIFTAYGPRQRPEMAIHKFTRLIDQGGKIPMYGDGSSRRDYTYIDDLIEGILASIHRHKGFEMYNLGESETTPLNELIQLIEEALDKKANIESLEPQPGDVSLTYANVTKARRMLGYEPKVNIKEGIKRFVEWYKGNK
jgi:UDP-glucuronate 4-epimerase